MQTWVIILIIIGLFVVVALLGLGLVLAKKSKQKKATEHLRVGEVDIKGGVRYTKSNEILNEDLSTKVSFNREDIILPRNKEFKIGKKEMIIPGKYTILSAHESTNKFYVRVGGIAREYKHADDIVLGAGETISAVSHTLILR